MKLRRVFLILTLGVLLVTYVIEGSTVVPIEILGNPKCKDVCLLCNYKSLETPSPPESTVYSDGTLTVTVIVDSAGEYFDWSSNIGVGAVIVKGGPSANVYLYPSESSGDTGLHAPINLINNHLPELSHITFCYVVPQITVTVGGLNDLTVHQQDIGDWSSTGDFTQSLGSLTVSITADGSVSYTAYVGYSVGSVPTPAFLGDPLLFDDPANPGSWPTIPPTSDPGPPPRTGATLPGLTGGTQSQTYPVVVDLTQLGDRTAGESFTFTVYVNVVVTASGI